MVTTTPLVAGGATLSFSWLQGSVVGTDQRSDSYTSGSGRMVVLEGNGAGSSSVSTEVVISRDIWIRDHDGQEHHIRINQDIPIRVGQEIALIYANGEKQGPAQPKVAKHGGLVSVYVVSTNRSYDVLSFKELAAVLAKPKRDEARLIKVFLAWAASLYACLAYGIGLIPLGYLIYRARLRRARIQADASAISGELQAGFQALLNSIHATHRARLAAPNPRSAALEQFD